MDEEQGIVIGMSKEEYENHVRRERVKAKTKPEVWQLLQEANVRANETK